jgi:hypothetical protein
MKPKKNRVFCPYSSKHKMVFKAEKEANLFMKYNGDEIEIATGLRPIRSYFCSGCGGWHITSSR